MFNRMVDHSHDELNRVFSAVADPTRRAILASLRNKSATISEIASSFPVSLNAISKHVMVLERAGLIHRNVQGREHVCSLSAGPLQDATAWLEHYRHFWEVRLDALENYVARKAKTAKRGAHAHGKFH